MSMGRSSAYVTAAMLSDSIVTMITAIRGSQRVLIFWASLGVKTFIKSIKSWFYGVKNLHPKYQKVPERSPAAQRAGFAKQNY